MMCIICGEDIQSSDDITYIGLDKPYINLKVHRSCFKNHKTKINEIIKNNQELLLQQIREQNNGKRKK